MISDEIRRPQNSVFTLSTYFVNRDSPSSVMVRMLHLPTACSYTPIDGSRLSFVYAGIRREKSTVDLHDLATPGEKPDTPVTQKCLPIFRANSFVGTTPLV